MREIDNMDGFRIGGTVINNIRHTCGVNVHGKVQELIQYLID